MKLYVLMGQRKCRYEGEYGLEALAVMSDWDNGVNANYLFEQRKKYKDSEEFAGLEIVELEVDEDKINAVLFPSSTSIPAKVIEGMR